MSTESKACGCANHTYGLTQECAKRLKEYVKNSSVMYRLDKPNIGKRIRRIGSTFPELPYRYGGTDGIIADYNDYNGIYKIVYCKGDGKTWMCEILYESLAENPYRVCAPFIYVDEQVEKQRDAFELMQTKLAEKDKEIEQLKKRNLELEAKLSVQ